MKYFSEGSLNFIMYLTSILLLFAVCYRAHLQSSLHACCIYSGFITFFLPRYVCLNPWGVNCLCRCVQVETPHFKVCMLWMESTFLDMRRPRVEVLSQYMFLRLAKGRCLTSTFLLRCKKPPFITVWIELQELIIACVCMCVERECVHWSSKSTNSSCFLQLCALSEIYQYHFPVLGALKAFLNPVTTGEQRLTKKALVSLGSVVYSEGQ